MIELKDIRKQFSGKWVLDGISLTIEEGETMVIVGGSGTGKSVTLKHMMGLILPDEGSITVDDIDITNCSKEDYQKAMRKFGVLFQSGALLNWMTVEENIGLPLYEQTKMGDDEIKEKVQETMKLVHLEGSENKYPSEISGGMKKRAALARAIIREPTILLYDEPTSGLDPVMSRKVDELIKDLQEELGVTSVVVTHDLHSAFSIANRITMLDKGKVVETSEPEKFAKSEQEVVKEFVRSQFETGGIEI